MDPLALRDRLVEDYAEFKRSFISLRHAWIRAVVERELEEGLLWPEPFSTLGPQLAGG